MSISKPTSFPRWATQLLANGPLGSNNRTEADESKKDTGWNHGERPARQFFNHLQWLNNEWIKYFDAQWNTAGQVNFNFSQNLDSTTGLTFAVDAGTVTFDGVESVIGSTSLILNANSTTVIGFDLDALTISQYTSGSEPVSDFVKLFVVTTNASAITNVDDRRTFFQVQSRLQSGDNKLIIDGGTDTFNYTNNGVSVIYADSATNVGINTSTPLGKLHVKTGESGVVSIDPSGNIIVAEGSGNSGITIATPATSVGSILFANPGSNADGSVVYSHLSQKLSLRAGGLVDKLTVDVFKANISLPTTIGSSSIVPEGMLHVYQGNSGVPSVSGIADGIVIEDAVDTGINIVTPNTATGTLAFGDPESSVAGYVQYSHSTDKLALATAGTTRVVVDSSGRVGAGVTSPSAQLHVSSGTSGASPLGEGVFLENDSDYYLMIGTGTTNTAGLIFADTGSNVVGSVQYSHADDKMHLGTSGTIDVTIDSQGKVGFGTQFPLASVHVRKGDSGVTPNGNAAAFFIEDATTTGFTVGSPNNVECNMLFADPQSSTVGGTQYNHANDVLALRAGDVQSVFVTATGMGVGTNTLLGKAHIKQGSSGVGSVNNYADGLVIEDLNPTGISICTSNSAFGILSFSDPQGESGQIFYNHVDDSFIFTTNSTQKVQIDSTGNLNVILGSVNLAVGSYKINNIDVLSSTTLGSGVVNSSLTSVGTLSSLNVSGNTSSATFKAGDGSAGLPSYAFGNDNDTGLFKPGIGSLALSMAGNERFRFTLGGELGVNTNDPLGKVHVKEGVSGVVGTSGDANTLILESDDNGGISILTPNNKVASIFFQDPEYSQPGSIRYNHNLNSLYIATNNVDRLVIDSSGNTTLSNDLFVTGNLIVNGTTTTINSTTVTVDDKNIELGSVAVPTDATADGGGITLKGTTDKTISWSSITGDFDVSENWDLSSGKSYKIGGTNVLTSSNLSLVNNTAPNAISLSRTSAVARNWTMGIDGDGGFRLTDASNSTVVLSALPSGLAYLASEGELAFKYNGSTEGMRLTTTGLGVGITPSSKLHVNGAARFDNATFFYHTNNTTRMGYIANQFIALGSGDTSDLFIVADTNLRFGAGGANEYMRLDSAGNVGIGTTLPTTKLDVNGGTRLGDGTVGYITTSADGYRLAFTRGDVSHINATNAAGFLGFGTGGVDQRMTLDATGKLLLGTTSSLAENFHISTGNFGCDATDINGSHDNIVIEDSDGGGITFLVNNTTGGAGIVVNSETSNLTGNDVTNAILGYMSDKHWEVYTGGTANIRFNATHTLPIGLGGTVSSKAIEVAGDQQVTEITIYNALSGNTAAIGQFGNAPGVNKTAGAGFLADYGETPALQWVNQQVILQDGSESAPSLTFQGDPDTGIFRSSTFTKFVGNNNVVMSIGNGTGLATLNGLVGHVFSILNTNNSDNTYYAWADDSGFQGINYRSFTNRSPSSLFDHIACNSGGDEVYRVDGTGHSFADGTHTTGGADYAEMFEWLDGNIDSEDRRGCTVALIDDKIKVAEQGDIIVGIISVNPSILGDGSELGWSGKWLRDEFGTKILDENGNQQYSPEYDPELEYIPRSKRKEWAPVGLMGKLVLRKGQVTAPSWIKLKDINENLELWLVK